MMTYLLLKSLSIVLEDRFALFEELKRPTPFADVTIQGTTALKYITTTLKYIKSNNSNPPSRLATQQAVYFFTFLTHFP